MKVLMIENSELDLYHVGSRILKVEASITHARGELTSQFGLCTLRCVVSITVIFSKIKYFDKINKHCVQQRFTLN